MKSKTRALIRYEVKNELRKTGSDIECAKQPD